MTDADHPLDQLRKAIAQAEAMGAAGLPQLFESSLRYAEIIEENRLPEWIDAADEDAPEGLDDWEEDDLEEDVDWENDILALFGEDDVPLELVDAIIESMTEMMDRMILETHLLGEITASTKVLLAMINNGDLTQRPRALHQLMQMNQLVVDGGLRIDLLGRIAVALLDAGEAAAATELAAEMETAIPDVMNFLRARVLTSIAGLYLQLDNNDKANQLLEEALADALDTKAGELIEVGYLLTIFVLLKAISRHERAREVLALASEKIKNNEEEGWFGDMAEPLIRAAEQAAGLGDRETALLLLDLAEQDIWPAGPDVQEETEDDDDMDVGWENDHWMSMIDLIGSDIESGIAMANVLLRLGEEQAARRITEQVLARLTSWAAQDSNPRHHIIPSVELALLLEQLGESEQAQTIMSQGFIGVQTIEQDCYRATPLAVIAYGWAGIGRREQAFSVLDRAHTLLLNCNSQDDDSDFFLDHGVFYLIEALGFLKDDARIQPLLLPAFQLADIVGGDLYEKEEKLRKTLIDLLLTGSGVGEEVVLEVIHDAFRRAREIHPRAVWYHLGFLAPAFARLDAAVDAWDEAVRIVTEAADRPVRD